MLAGCASRSPNSTTQAQSNATPAPFHRTITIVTTNRFVFVGGEVRHPGRFNWAEGLTLTNAVQAAGGFTDFANRSGLELRRADGSFERYSYARILKGLTNSPVLNPNDQLIVRKRYF